MSNKKSRLGRGLDALLQDINLTAMPTRATAEKESYTIKETTKEKDLQHLPIEWLQRGQFQPRRTIADTQLQELAASIRAEGIIQPLLVRPVGVDRYEIIAGERRWRAAQLAGLDRVPVLIRELENKTALAIGLIENIQREDLNPIDTALGMQRLLSECQLTHQEVATALGKSRSTVSNLLRLLELSFEVKEMVAQGLIEMGHARALLSLPTQQQLKLINIIVNKQLSVRQTERLVALQQTPKRGVTSHKTKKTDPNILHLQEKLSDQLGTNVTIKHSPKGNGELIIRYHSNDELEGILEQILKHEAV
jgi:ParB family chromosome partitioning protein